MLMLALILLLAFFIACIPHFSYPYPLHWDEWRNLSYANSIMDAGRLGADDPVLRSINMGPEANPYAAFCLFVGIVQRMTGIPDIVLFRWLPGMMFMLTVLAVYIFGRRMGFGLEAAFMACFIPSSVGILGPVFLTALSAGLIFVPLTLFLAFNARGYSPYVLVLLFAAFLFLIHPPSAVILCIIILPYLLLGLKGSFKRSAVIALALGLPALAVLLFIYGPSFMRELGGLFQPGAVSSYTSLPPLLLTYGYLPLALAAAGIIYLIVKRGARGLGIVLGVLLLVVVMVVFYRTGYGLSTIYERGLTLLLLMLGIMAGAALSWIKGLKIGGRLAFLRNAGNYLAGILIAAVLAMSVPAHVTTPYYHIIDEEDYGAFAWARDNLELDGKALLDPWKAVAFSAVTRIPAARMIYTKREPVDDRVDAFLRDGCLDSAVLRDNGISLVYNRYACDNADLINVKENVYLVSPILAEKFGELNEKNLIQNAGFEILRPGFSQFWIRWSQYCRPRYLFPEPGRLYAYGQCIGLQLKAEDVDSEPAGTPQVRWLQKIPVVQGKSYRIGAWLKTQDIAGKGGAGIIPLWRNSENVPMSSTKIMDNVSGTREWAYYEGLISAPEGAAFCTVECCLIDCTGTAWFDDMLLEPLE